MPSMPNSPVVRIRKKLPPFASFAFPDPLLATIFAYLPLSDLQQCMLTCRDWHRIVMADKSDEAIWEQHAREDLPEAALGNRARIMLGEAAMSWRERLRAFRHAWNPMDSSKNTFVRENGFTVHRHPVAQSTDGIRTKIGVRHGIHAWDLIWDGPLGTSAVVGVASMHAALHSPGYLPLIGSDDQSWGWNLVDNTLLHNGVATGRFPLRRNAPKYQVGERIRMVLDCDNHLLYFEKADHGGEFLGIAFTELPPIRLFAAMSAVYGNTEVSCIYVGQPSVG